MTSKRLPEGSFSMISPNNRSQSNRVTVDVDKETFQLAVDFCDNNKPLIEKVQLKVGRERDILSAAVSNGVVVYKVKKYVYEMMKEYNRI